MTNPDDYKYPHSLKSLSVLHETRTPPAPLTPLAPAAAPPQPHQQPAAAGESAAAAASPQSQIERKLLEGRIIAALRTVYDPEIPVNIYDLGLIYEIRIRDDGYVEIKMTLTAPGCPVAGTMPGEVQQKVRAVDGVDDADVELVWDPPWDRSRMSEEAQLALGFL